jgi:hypothetical protein
VRVPFSLTHFLPALLLLSRHPGAVAVAVAIVILFSKNMPMDASASLMHRRYRMYTTRLSETDTDLYPIAEEESQTRKWPFYALVTCSFALVVFLCVSAASYSQEEYSHGYRLPTFDKRNRFTQQKRTLENNCSDGLYSKRTLQRAYELPFSALFPNPKGQNKFEASSVIVVDDYSYAVCDSSWAISKFGRSLTPFSPHNVQIGDPNREPEVSQHLCIHSTAVVVLVCSMSSHYYCVVRILATRHSFTNKAFSMWYENPST